MLVRFRCGDAAHLNPSLLTREVGQLYSRLPDDAADAIKTLELLKRFLNFIEEGIIDLNGVAEAPKGRAAAKMIERAFVQPRGHLKLVGSD